MATASMVCSQSPTKYVLCCVWPGDLKLLTNGLQASSLLIEKKEGSSLLEIVRPFLATPQVDTAGRTSLGSLCYGALNQIVVGADQGAGPISFAKM
jgi:hypothetical protein